MKSLPVKSQHYNYLLKAYQEYLQITGFAPKTALRWPVHVRELFHYLEKRNISHITAVESNHVNDFIDHIKRRQNKSKDGGLSNSSINGIINAVNGFAKFLNSTGKYVLDLTMIREEPNTGEKNILTVEQVKELYEVTFQPYEWNSVAMGQRDRAIIALYYGCGLRRGEGVQLNINDIDLQKRLLFVKKAKGYKQRYVPIAARHVNDIVDYIKEGREWFLYCHGTNDNWRSSRGRPPVKKDVDHENAFLLTHHGTRFLQPEWRLKYLLKQTSITTNITLHGLRHSIATHLLQSGMDIEEIAKFLGHSSLVSTQIYTHIVNQLQDDERV
ncbi:MAG: tyrosine-type recombinase/integrase [Chitinophagaceae bacterium]|nr:tyrosine-type recombinase/integrase [Chitinophagaceae bacterium]